MKNHLRRVLILGIALLLALLITARTQSVAVQSSNWNGNAGAVFLFQSTATPQPEDRSEIGSTDGIVTMGGAIALIIIVPIILRHKYWSRAAS